MPPDALRDAPSCAPAAGDRDVAFSAVNVAFGSLGRVCMALDGEFRVRYASALLDTLLGPAAAAQARGQSIDALLGPELFGPEGPLREALLAGEKREGWRAVLQAPDGVSRLMSVSAAPLIHDGLGVCDPEARYLVVMRPADEATVEASGPIAGFGLIARSQAMGRVFRLIDTLQHSADRVVRVAGERTRARERARVCGDRLPGPDRPARGPAAGDHGGRGR